MTWLPASKRANMVKTPISYSQHLAHVRPLRGRQVRLNRPTEAPGYVAALLTWGYSCTTSSRLIAVSIRKPEEPEIPSGGCVTNRNVKILQICVHKFTYSQFTLRSFWTPNLRTRTRKRKIEYINYIIYIIMFARLKNFWKVWKDLNVNCEFVNMWILSSSHNFSIVIKNDIELAWLAI